MERLGRRRFLASLTRSSNQRPITVSNPTPTTQSPPRAKMNVYTFMLIVSFVALLIGSVLLFSELLRYGSYPWWKASGS